MLDIKLGDIILVRGQGPISRLIRWFTNSEYSHVGIALNQDLIFEIEFNRQMAIYPNRYPDFDVYRYKRPLTFEEKDKMLAYAIKKAKASQGYDWRKIIEFALYKLLGKTIFMNRKNKFICSEIVDKIYAAAGIDLLPSRKNGDVRPSDLANSPELICVSRHQSAIA